MFFFCFVLFVCLFVLYSSSVYSCDLLISSASVRSIPFLFFIEPILARNVSLDCLIFWIDSSIFHSIVLLYFFALIAEEDVLTLPDILWNSALKWINLSFSPLLLSCLLFTVLCKAFSDSCFAFLFVCLFVVFVVLLFSFIFFLWMILIPVPCTMSQTSIHSSYVVYNMLNAMLEEAQAWIKNAGRNIKSPRYLDKITLMAKSEEM